MSVNLSLVRKLESLRPFTEKEAWNLFKITALSEAVGWTLLGSGVIIARYKLPGSHFAVPIAGRIHGTIFLAYFGVLLAAYSSLGWSRQKFLIAILAGIPPYGTLVFEQWAARSRHKVTRQAYRRVTVHAVITDGKTVLAVQPSHGVNWQLPGGEVQSGETTEDALRRILRTMFGTDAKLSGLRHVRQTHSKSGKDEDLEFYFSVSNHKIFQAIDLQSSLKTNTTLDDIQFVAPAETPDLEPSFLHDLPLKTYTKIPESVSFLDS